jgi:hypothetical protein
LSIYLNQPDVQLELPDDAPAASQPVIRPFACVKPGLRGYSRGEWDLASNTDAVTVTESGHWFHTADKLALADGAPIGWMCRGCGTVATESLLAPELGRCPKPATAQDIASALLSTLRPGPAEMVAQPRIRFIRTAVAA